MPNILSRIDINTTNEIPDFYQWLWKQTDDKSIFKSLRISDFFGFWAMLLRMSWTFLHITFENYNYDNRLDGAIKTTLANGIEKITEKTAKRMKWHNEMQNATKSSSHRVLNIPTCITMSVYGLKHIFFLSLIIHVFICNFELIRVLNMRF